MPIIVPIIARDTVVCSCSWSGSELSVVAPAVTNACVVREATVVSKLLRLLSAVLVFGSAVVVEGVCDDVRDPVACSRANTVSYDKC